jgi:hypothetical protein
MENKSLGNPEQYSEMYSNGKPFLTDDGQLVPDATASQKQAYNEWLKDPAVAKALDQKFLERDHGRSTSATGN